MSAYKQVDGDCIGFAGCVQTDLYKLFLKMQEKFNTEELVHLTNHKSTTVRVYAFWALCKMKYPEFRTILNKHLNDKTMFLEIHTDTGVFLKVSEFYLALVDPTAMVFDDCIKLTDAEYEVYKSKIK
jgi:hypothetical protein